MATQAGSLAEMKLDERSYNAAMKRLSKYEGAAFKKRMEVAFLAGARLAVSPMKRRAPGSLTKVSTRKGRPPSGYFIKVGTKSRRPHAGLVTKGHRIVTPGGRYTGRYSTPNPYVEQTIASYEGRIIRFISEATTDEGVGAFGSLGGF